MSRQISWDKLITNWLQNLYSVATITRLETQYLEVQNCKQVLQNHSIVYNSMGKVSNI
jgi:hypothetical protein